MRGKAWMVSGLPATVLPRLPETSCPRCPGGIFGSTIVLGTIKWQWQCRVLRCRLPDGTCPRAAQPPEEPRKDGGAQHQGGAGVLQPLGTREQRWVGGQIVGLGVWEGLGSSELCSKSPGLPDCSGADEGTAWEGVGLAMPAAWVLSVLVPWHWIARGGCLPQLLCAGAEQGCSEDTHICLLAGTQVRVLAVPQGSEVCTSGVGLGNNQGRGELKYQ